MADKLYTQVEVDSIKKAGYDMGRTEGYAAGYINGYNLGWDVGFCVCNDGEGI